MSASLLRERLALERWSAGTARNLGYAYRGPADFVLREGRAYDPARARYIRGAPRMCFGNALANACANERSGWRYVEGYAMPPFGAPGYGMAIHHAWVTDAEGTLVEATWMPAGSAYLGVEFSVERADDCTWNGDASVLDDFYRRWPILRARWQGEDPHQPWPHSPRLELIRRKARGLEVTRAELEQAMSD